MEDSSKLEYFIFQGNFDDGGTIKGFVILENKDIGGQRDIHSFKAVTNGGNVPDKIFNTDLDKHQQSAYQHYYSGKSDQLFLCCERDDITQDSDLEMVYNGNISDIGNSAMKMTGEIEIVEYEYMMSEILEDHKDRKPVRKGQGKLSRHYTMEEINEFLQGKFQL